MASYNVRWHTTGTKHFRHPVVGDLALAHEGLEFAGDPGRTLITFTAEPGSPSQEALTFLANWTTSPKQTTAHDRTSEDHTA